MDYEKLKQYWFLATSGIHKSKTIAKYKPQQVLDSWNFTNYLHTSRKEEPETIEEWTRIHKLTIKPLTLNLLFNEKFQAWTLAFETLEEIQFYNLIHRHLMVSEEFHWDYASSAMYNFSKAAFTCDFTISQNEIDDLYNWCIINRPDLLIDDRIASILTIKPVDIDVII